MTLTKALIIESISKQTGFSKNKSTEIIEIILETIKHSVESGDDVLISKFGKFCVKNKSERRGRNPATGEDMMLSPMRVVTFRCSKSLRAKINKK
jgi:integration host factor subunit alpha